MFCSSPSLCVPLFIVPTKRLRLPCVLFICECAFVYCASKETQTALCFVIYLTVCLCLSCQPAKKTQTTQCFLLLQTALCFVIYLWVCLCLSCQQRDSDCHVFCSSSSQCAVVYHTNEETQTAPYFVVHHCMCLCLLLCTVNFIYIYIFIYFYSIFILSFLKPMVWALYTGSALVGIGAASKYIWAGLKKLDFFWEVNIRIH